MPHSSKVILKNKEPLANFLHQQHLKIAKVRISNCVKTKSHLT